ncbi:MAG: beta-ketoacyl synthase N-terminal-like domain-containing protein [Phycisphaerae bacterium]
MNGSGRPRVAVTGVGLITPLGASADEVLSRIDAGASAAAAPTGFDASCFPCQLCAEIADFAVGDYVGDTKTLRLMNRDAQLAVAAARLAVRDARLTVGKDYADEDIALYGSTGMASMPAAEVVRLVRHAASDDGSLDLKRFGEVALKRVRPVLSFKILSNMPICFVSIFEGIRGPNAVYTPWEGQGVQAITAGLQAVRRGDVPCALVGGCDVKTNELAFLALAQQSAFDAWSAGRVRTVPGEGSAFLVLEDEAHAQSRGARVYATLSSETELAEVDLVVAAGSGENSASDCGRIYPKAHLGDLFAAAAAVQVALAAVLAGRLGSSQRAMAECFGHGGEGGTFVLESA